MIIGLTILWVAYALLEGNREGYFYGYSISYAPKKNLHGLFTLQRSIVLIFIGTCLFLSHYYLLRDLSILFGLSLIFPFFHDGIYYITRHKINPLIYPEGWLSESTTSTAKIELDLKSRIIFLVVGLGILTINIIL